MFFFQYLSEANGAHFAGMKGLNDIGPLFDDDDIFTKEDTEGGKAKRGARSYLRAMQIKNSFRGFSRANTNRDAPQTHFNPLMFWKNFVRQNDGAKRNEREMMTISVTHNLDILRRRLLKEIALRERQRTQKELMMKNKGILGNIGR